MLKNTIDNPREITDEIISLFELHGNENYDGEPVSQTSHMIQCAMQAMAEGSDMELVLGSFLHDAGHLLRHKMKTEEMDRYGAVNHEGIGAAYLREKGFSERICAMVEKHVDAKRFLVATDESYNNKLSEASRQTLIWQGGPMNNNEVSAFRRHPYFDDIIKVRLWDEKAKEADAALLPLHHFKNLIFNYLTNKK